MRLGSVYPQAELKGDPAAMLHVATSSEALGYDHFVLYDHPVVAVNDETRDPPVPGPYGHTSTFHDPLVAFGWLAAQTTTINFVTGVLVLTERQTALVARQTADVDLFSHGRLRLGVGVGYNPIEWEAMAGDGWTTRGRRMNEQIPYLRRLWTEEDITFEGEFHRIDRANISPRPARSIPIWCGGLAEPALRRGARLGDGFIFSNALNTPDATIESWERVKGYLREYDRPVEGFDAAFTLYVTGRGSSLKEIAEILPRLRDAGATDALIDTTGHGFTSAEENVDFLAEAKQVAEDALR